MQFIPDVESKEFRREQAQAIKSIKGNSSPIDKILYTLYIWKLYPCLSLFSQGHREGWWSFLET